MSSRENSCCKFTGLRFWRLSQDKKREVQRVALFPELSCDCFDAADAGAVSVVLDNVVADECRVIHLILHSGLTRT